MRVLSRRCARPGALAPSSLVANTLRGLRDVQEVHGNRWSEVARHIGTKTGQQCAQRWRHRVNPNISKEKWTEAEDNQLTSLVRQYGSCWAEISRNLPGRTDQQCMGRWRRHLDPSVRRVSWHPTEDEKLRELVAEHGASWSFISRFMEGRTAQQVRARWCQLESLESTPASLRVKARQGGHANRPSAPAKVSSSGDASLKKHLTFDAAQASAAAQLMASLAWGGAAALRPPHPGPAARQALRLDLEHSNPPFFARLAALAPSLEGSRVTPIKLSTALGGGPSLLSPPMGPLLSPLGCSRDGQLESPQFHGLVTPEWARQGQRGPGSTGEGRHRDADFDTRRAAVTRRLPMDELAPDPASPRAADLQGFGSFSMVLGSPPKKARMATPVRGGAPAPVADAAHLLQPESWAGSATADMNSRSVRTSLHALLEQV
ncbi:Myb-like protein A [Auxenochlorella protothecoides]|uniref:Myb-like protein A n=1 Tax=Auxenochlorella protothecoides TaxID=3075 RepID=A0A087SKQ6_AUXPR|nr:Myb-like protein A [Auxenochlorella protothecoides]KFM26310.1 Myb-like protein A [Auxenochlorella protothecoides]